MEIDRVNCFQSATTGYAPLIFNIKEECNYTEFHKQCTYVWKELKSDPKLPEKLVSDKNSISASVCLFLKQSTQPSIH